jgi:psp operon transcriptional activator
MNCAAISESLLETELFGHEVGAFTGATKMHQGRFERADKGSLFLDELATTSALVQEKLLRIIEYGEYERVGGSKTLNVDVRLIAATNEDLPSLANAGRFREDLLDRLAFDVITLPPLRARAEDIILLAEQFAVTMASDLGMELFPGFSDKAIETLLAHQWPGNIRELKNVVERSVYRAADDETPVDVITLDPFDSIFRPTGSRDKTIAASSKSAEPNRHSFPLDFKQTVQDYEIDLIQKALSASQFNQKKTAETLGVTYHQLRGYMKKYELFENN